MNKIEKIENLLKNEQDLNDYINSLEQIDVCVPKDLSNNILLKVKRKKARFYSDILKVAACLIFTLSICQTDFMTNDRLGEYTKREKTDNAQIEEKVSKICDLFTKPINLGGEK